MCDTKSLAFNSKMLLLQIMLWGMVVWMGQAQCALVKFPHQNASPGFGRNALKVGLHSQWSAWRWIQPRCNYTAIATIAKYDRFQAVHYAAFPWSHSRDAVALGVFKCTQQIIPASGSGNHNGLLSLHDYARVKRRSINVIARQSSGQLRVGGIGGYGQQVWDNFSRSKERALWLACRANHSYCHNFSASH